MDGGTIAALIVLGAILAGGLFELTPTALSMALRTVARNEMWQRRYERDGA